MPAQRLGASVPFQKRALEAKLMSAVRQAHHPDCAAIGRPSLGTLDREKSALLYNASALRADLQRLIFFNAAFMPVVHCLDRRPISAV